MTEKHWKIEKYARFKKDMNEDIMSTGSKSGDWQTNRDGTNMRGMNIIQGTTRNFKHIVSTQSKPILITVTQPLNLVLQAGNEVLESFTLLQSSKWLKGIARNDSMLFFYRIKNDVRRFRIKFASQAPQCSKDMCDDFVRVLSQHVHVQIVDNCNESQVSQSQCSGAESNSTKYVAAPIQTLSTEEIISKRKPVADIAKDFMAGNSTLLPSGYQVNNLHVEEVNISCLIKTCLLDPNFPGFVDEVEKSLKSMMETS